MNNLLKHSLFVCLLFCFTPLFAQRRASADVEVKTVVGKSVTTVIKSVYCSNNGRSVTYVHKPLEYIVTANAFGESKFYFPGSNEVFVDYSGAMYSSDELLSIFLLGRLDDLGVTLAGYAPKQTEHLEGGIVRKTYFTTKTGMPPLCEIVYDSNYLPIYSATLTEDGHPMVKVYYSKYEYFAYSPFPTRSTQIVYNSPKDSTIIRTVYSNIQLDGNDAMFDFEVPEGAKPVDRTPAGK